jgi:hypothetical protein
MVRISVAALAAALAAGCSITPTVTKVETTMTPREIRESGLECRRLVPIDTNVPRTICASPAAWEDYGEKTRMATDDFLAKGRELGTPFRQP